MKRREASVSRHAKLARIFVIGAKRLAGGAGIKQESSPQGDTSNSSPITHHASLYWAEHAYFSFSMIWGS